MLETAANIGIALLISLLVLAILLVWVVIVAFICAMFRKLKPMPKKDDVHWLTMDEYKEKFGYDPAPRPFDQETTPWNVRDISSAKQNGKTDV